MRQVNIFFLEERIMTKKLLSLIVLLAISSAVANAAELQWFGGAHDRDWSNTANWGPTGGPIPTSVDKAKLNYVWANPGPIVSTPGAVANEIFISEDRDLGTIGEQSLTIATGGTLTANGQVLLGYYGADSRAGLPANEGRIIMEGGTANLLSHLFVGFGGTGHVVVNSGTLNVAGMFGLAWNGGHGDVTINGGVLHTAQYNLAPVSGTAHMTINGGEWVEDHFWVSEIQALIAAGTITSDVGALQVTWDSVLEQTHVSVIPEPVSIALFGLGALLLRKRS
jgi:hypothetical protein